MLTAILAFGPLSAGLLGDADTGWHIRTGEIVLATRSVPRTDLFSYTKAGQPWFAWEWLYDAAVAAIHHFAGLNGVVLFSAAIIALTFSLLFRFVLQRSGSFVVAMALAVLSVSAARVHMLARPHLLTWLFTLLWVEALYRFEEGRRAALLWLPPLMLVWVNVHGGFILGLALLGIFACGCAWRWLRTRSREELRQLAQLAAAFCACVAVSFVTPYGYKLHVHIYDFLSKASLLDSINEYMSPNFHTAVERQYEWFLLLCICALAWARERVSATDLLILLFSIHSGLYAVRNVPVAVLLMSLVLGRLWAAAMLHRELQGDAYPFASLVEIVKGISQDMAAMEKRFRGHLLAAMAVIAAWIVAMHGGRAMSAQFNAKTFPVKAAEYIAAQNIHDHLFNTDRWSGYLIYRLYPQTRLFVDDRFDFYGPKFMQQYVNSYEAKPEWSQVLDQYTVRWVLIPPDSPLAAVLKESKQWQLQYHDDTAVLFVRRQ